MSSIDKSEQAKKFRQAARELEADTDEKRFNRLIGRLAKKPKPEPKNKKG